MSATRLAEIMQTQGRQQIWLADRTGLTPVHVNRLVRGHVRMTPRCARLIGQALGVPDAWLLTEGGDQEDRRQTA